MSTGQGFGYSLFGNSIKSNDVTAINNYANALKNGTSVGEAWRTTMNSTSVAAKQYVLNARKAGKSTAELTQGLNNMTLGAKASTVAMKALGVAKNVALNVGVMLLITGVAKGIDYLIHRTEKMQEALQNSVDEFNTVTDELKTLEEELKTTTERLKELQKLADNGTISVAEEAELENLKKTNKELARKIALKQQEQAQEARDVLKDSRKNANSTVSSKYNRKTTSSGNSEYGVSVTPDEELELAIKEYETNSKALENNRGTNLEGWYEDQTESAKNRIEEMYDLISPTIDAYEDLINAGIELEGEDKTRYEQLKKTQDAYLAYIYTLNGTKEAFEGLNAEQQRNVLLNRLIKQGLSEDVAKAIIGSISDEDLSKYWDKNFSFVPPEMKDGETAEEYGKRYAEAWAKGLEEGAKNANKMTDSLKPLNESLDKIQSAYQAVQSAIEEYNKEGYLSVDTFQSLMELEPQYLNMLLDENGNLNLNTTAVQENTAAYIENMGVKAAQNLIDSVSALSGASAQMEYLTGVTNENTSATWDNIYAQLAQAEAVSDPAVMDALYTRINAIQQMTESAKAGIGKGGLGKDASQNAEKLADAWKKEHLESLKDGLKQQEDILNRYKKNIDITNWGLSLANENDFELKADLLSNKIDQLTSYGVAMRQEFERVADIIPETGDEAQELASRLESLGGDMRDNISTLRETQVELEKLKINALSSVGDYYLSDLETTLDSIQNRIELLGKDNKEDYRYTNQILSMKALLPTVSGLTVRTREKNKESRNLITIEQETQDKINEIVTKSLEMQAVENAKAREKERQNLMADMEVTRQLVKQKLDESAKDYEKHSDEVTSTTNTMIEEVSNAVSNMNLKIPKPDLSEFTAGLEEAKKIIADNFDDKGAGAVSVANTALGIPYVWGGTNLSMGVDCSGLTYSSYQKLGVDIGRTTYDQWAKAKEISRDELKPGDLVFSRFGADGKEGPAHVGMYIGDGKTIEAPSRGKPVQYSSIEKWERYARPVYADGTPNGNAQADKLGIAGENFKPEILIDKATGKTQYIDKPTVIDTTKTDVVGENATAKLPKFADGTIDLTDKIIGEILDSVNNKLLEINESSISSVLNARSIYNDDSLSDIEKQTKLFHEYKDASTRYAQIGTSAYSQLLQQFNDYIWEVNNNPNVDYNQEIVDAYIDGLNTLEDKVFEFEDNVSSTREMVAIYFEEAIEDIDKFIDKRNAYNDWDNWGTTELKELAKQKTILRDMLNQELISLEVFNERIAETNQRMYETMKEQTVDVLNHRSSQMSSLKTLLQSHYDVSNAVSDAQYEINKELAASKTMYQHLNEETRKLLFNQEDYNTLSEKLVDIQSEANKLQDQYSRDILGATENELDKITSQYEMQYETLMKTYEIAKAELEVAKKRQQLDNVLKERNVRMFIDGQWQWVANTQDVINAQNELADAEHTRRQNEASLQQTQSLNELQKAQDILTTTISNVEDGIVDFAKYTETMNIELDGIVTESIPGLNDAILLSQSAIRTFAKSLSLSGKGSTTSSFHNGVFYESGVDYKSEMTKSDTTLSEALALNTQRDAKIDGDGRSEGKMTNTDVIKLWKESHGYAGGTDNTSDGWITLGELEKEWLIKSNGQFVPIQEPTLANVGSGGIVFNQNQMDNVRKLWNLSNLDNFALNNLSSKSGTQSIDNSNSNNVIIEKLTIDGNSTDGKTILTTLRRVAANH